MEWFDDSDSLDTIINHAMDPDNPQSRGVPDSIQKAALEELRRRGYDSAQITNIRLYGTPDKNKD